MAGDACYVSQLTARFISFWSGQLLLLPERSQEKNINMEISE
jgi:hypothetical protein